MRKPTNKPPQHTREFCPTCSNELKYFELVLGNGQCKNCAPKIKIISATPKNKTL